jgi:hypothetical protein
MKNIVLTLPWEKADVDVVFCYSPPQKETRDEYGWDPALPEELEIEQVLYKGVDVIDLFDVIALDYFLDMGWDHVKDDGSDL